MEADWEQKEAHVWKVYTEERYLPSFTFTWFYESKYLQIEIGKQRLGPCALGYAKDMLKALEDILGDDETGIASYAEDDDSTELFRGCLENGQDYPYGIKLHAYVEMRDYPNEPVRYTISQAQAIREALKEALYLIEMGYEGDEPWCLFREGRE